MKFTILQIFFYTFFLPFAIGNKTLVKDNNEENEKTASEREDDLNLAFFRKAFKIKRAQQLEAVKNLVGMKDYTKQYKLVKILTQNIFKMLQESKTDIAASEYIPGDSFPKKKETMMALALILENTAFFGDILLRLPDMTHEIYRTSKEWQLLAKWSVSYSNETRLYDEIDTKLINLMAQELQLVPKDPYYTNPYKVMSQLEQAMVQELNRQNDNSQKKKQKKKRKGPRLSGDL